MDDRGVAPLSTLSEVRLGLLSTKDIVSLSVRAINKRLDVTHTSLGLPSISGNKCSTCGANSPKECPGHFGHVPLTVPVYHPRHLRKLRSILSTVCLNCGKRRKKKKKARTVEEEDEEESEQGEGEEEEKDEETVEKRGNEEKRVIVKPKAVTPSNQDYYINLSDEDEDEDFYVDIMADAQTAKKAGCRFCDGSYKHPIVSVVSTKLQRTQRKPENLIEIIILSCPGMGDPPNGYWNFLGRTSRGRREVKLSPQAVLSILKKIPAKHYPGLDIESLIMETLPVPPNCMQSLLDPRTGTVSLSSGGPIQALGRIISENNVKVSESTRPAKWKTLQHLISQYFRHKGCPKIQKSREPWVKPGTLTKFHEIWKTKVKKTIHSKMTNFCAIALLTGDPCVGVEEILIPDEISRQLTVPQQVTDFNRDKLQACVNELKAGFIELNGVNCDLRGMSAERRQLEVGAVVHRPVQDGDLVFVTRHPALNKHAVIALTARIFGGKSFRINPILCTPLKADFDGDRLQVYFPQAEDARVETKELMTLKHQFSSVSSGNPILKLTQDVLVAVYILVSRPVFLTASQVQQLAVHCDRWSLPDASIVKPRPLWTGLQAFGMLLPSNLVFSTNSGVLISDGELLKVGEDFSWLGSGSESLLRAIYEKLGVEQALCYLDSCCSMVREFLQVEGFSVGLGDFRLEHRQKEEVSRLLVHAKRYYTEEQDLREGERRIEQVIKKGLKKENRLHAMMEAGSKGSAASARCHVGCLGVQAACGKTTFVDKSFWSGLDQLQFWEHSVCSRDIFLKSLQLQERGIMGTLLSRHLEGVCVAYDDSVRSRRQVIQFGYGNESAQPGEAVGMLAASVVIEHIYDVGHKELKELLLSNHKNEALTKKATVLRCNNQGGDSLEKRLLDLKEQLEPVQLQDVATTVKIEYEGILWLCHFSLDSELIDRLNLNLESIRQTLSRQGFPCEILFSCGGQGACLHYLSPDTLDEIKCSTIPALLQLYIAGRKGIHPEIVQNQQELVLKTNASFKSLVLLDLDAVDWRRSSPSTVQEVYDTLGIEAARQFIYQRLMTMMSADVKRCHIELLADFATHTGKVLGYTEVGLKEFLSSIDESTPFQRLALDELEFAAENGLCDNLQGVKSSTAWGKRPVIGTASKFDLIWNVDDSKWNDVDIYEFLASEAGICKPLTPSIAEGRKVPQQSEHDSWGVAPTTENSDSGWGTSSANLDSGWGSSAENLNSGFEASTGNLDSGWGVSTENGSGLLTENLDSGWGTSTVKLDSGPTKNLDSGWGLSTENLDSGWGASTIADTADGWGSSAVAGSTEPVSVDGWGQSSEVDEASGWGSRLDDSDKKEECGARIVVDDGLGQTPDVEDADDSEQRPKRKYVPTGANTVPLGRRRRFPNANADLETANEIDKDHNTGNLVSEVPGAASGKEDKDHDTAEDNCWGCKDPDTETGWNAAPNSEVEDADESERQQQKQKRKFVPTGANTVPLGPRRGCPNESANLGSEKHSGTAKEEGNNNHNSGSFASEVPGTASEKGEEDDGWGCSTIETETGWNAAPDSGWGDAAGDNTGKTSSPGWGNAASNDAEKSSSPTKPFQHRESRPPPDPLKKRFWEEVVKVVNEARIVLRSYRNGDRLSEEHETMVTERMLVHHPSYDQKVGTGIDFLKVDRPSEFPESSCFFVVRRDGTEVDFSYHKCLEAFVAKNFPENYVAKYNASCRPQYKDKS